MARMMIRLPSWFLAFAPAIVLSGSVTARSHAQQATDPIPALLARHVGVYPAPPSTVGELDPAIKAYRIPDGPLMGNGDLAVAVGGTDAEQTFYLSKSDLSHSMRGLGGLTYSFDATPSDRAKYRQEQDIYRSEVRSVLPFAGGAVKMLSWTADAGNVLVTDLWTEQGTPLNVGLRLWSHPNGSTTRAFAEDGIIVTTREVDTKMGTTAQPFRSGVAMATRVLGATAVCSTNHKNSSTAGFALAPGQRVRIVTVVAGGYQAADFIPQAKARAASLDDRAIDDLRANHLDWWRNYWSRSYLTLDDDLLERFYYGALYVLGCSSREGSNPPGLAGPWHLHGPICWSNKYTLDYNFESVWWGAYSCNRPELALPYYEVILKLIPAGRQLAREHGTKGVLFGVNAHAWGGFTDTRTLNMKGNASLASLNFMMHYRYTRDERFLVEKAWPLLKELAIFWEDNLEWDRDHSRWMIRDSGAREGGKDTNPITDLSYVNRLFQFLLDTADTLEGKTSEGEIIHISEARKEKWRDYLGRLGPYPTIQFDGKTVFKEAANRNKMCLGGPGDNSDVLTAVFPSEAIGLGSDPELLQIARNTVAALNPDKNKASWFQANCFPKIYTQAVRSGYPAEIVVENLKLLLEGRQPYDDRGDHVRLRNNLTIVPPVHGLESVGAIEAIDSLLLQSHDDTIRVFPVWLKGKKAAFKDLRAVGAFLVSGETDNGQVSHVDIKSEAGGPCRVANPWPGRTCEILSVGEGQPERISFRLDRDAIRFETQKGKRYRIRPS